MPRPIERCRACGNRELIEILDLGLQALTGVFPRHIEERVEKGPLRLVKCHGPEACNLVQLAHSYDADQMYGENYGYRSGLNPSMARHLRNKVQRILQTFDPPSGSLVVDVGSNDGTTLAAFPHHFRRLGIDPTASKFLEFYEPGIEVIPDFFSRGALEDAVGEAKASVITSFSMFYDLDDPLQFMGEIVDSLAPGGVWVFEQSYMPLMLERNSYDTVCHEHIEYYTLSQISWMAERVGLTLVDVEFNDINGGSFSITAGRRSDAFIESSRVQEVLSKESSIGTAGLEPYHAFARRVEQSRASLRKFIDDAGASGARIGALGASTKGNVILQYCEVTPAEIVAIGEVNDDKFGSFTPGTLIPILPEREVLDMELDYLLVLPWHFRETFLAKQLSPGTRLVFPLPLVEIVGRASEVASGSAD